VHKLREIHTESLEKRNRGYRTIGLVLICGASKGHRARLTHLQLQRVLEAQLQNLHLPHWFNHVVKWIVMRWANVNFAILNIDESVE